MIKGKRINFRLSETLLQHIDSLAEKIGIERSEFIRSALIEKIQSIEEKQFLKRDSNQDRLISEPSGTYVTRQNLKVNLTGYDLVALRDKYKLTQSELARKTGVARQTISRLEEGKTKFLRNDSKRRLENFFNQLREREEREDDS